MRSWSSVGGMLIDTSIALGPPSYLEIKHRDSREIIIITLNKLV